MALKMTSAPGLVSAWSYLHYSLTKSRKAPRMLTLLGFAMILQIFLGALTSVADTWLHVAATSVWQKTITPQQLAPGSAYSRQLWKNCTSGPLAYKNESSTQSCAVPLMLADSIPMMNAGNAGGARSALFGVAEGLSTINGVSKLNSILSVNNITFIAPATVKENVTFNATSQGLRSHCIPISQACNFSYGTPNYPSAAYNCGTQYPGVLTSGRETYGFNSVWFNLTIVGSDGRARPLGTGMNPFNVFVEATIDTPARGIQDPEFVAQNEGTQAILLWCEIEVLDITFSMGVGPPSILQTNQSSNATTFALSSVLGSSADFPAVSQPLWLAAEMAAISSNSTIYASQFASQLSRTAIGLGAGVVSSASTLSEVTQTSALVSRLPKAPLFTLVGSFLLYGLTSTAIAISILFTRKGQLMTSQDVEVVKNRIADPVGIVQEHFGEAALVMETNGKKMFHDDRDGVIRVLAVEERGDEKNMLLELVRDDTPQSSRVVSLAPMSRKSSPAPNSRANSPTAISRASSPAPSSRASTPTDETVHERMLPLAED